MIDQLQLQMRLINYEDGRTNTYQLNLYTILALCVPHGYYTCSDGQVNLPICFLYKTCTNVNIVVSCTTSLLFTFELSKYTIR